jgi:hypothetical protein
MHIPPITSPIPFGIYKGSINKPYGEYMWGEYKKQNIEVFNAYKHGQKLIYVSDAFKRFIKSKLIYFMDGVKKVTRAEGR